MHKSIHHLVVWPDELHHWEPWSPSDEQHCLGPVAHTGSSTEKTWSNSRYTADAIILIADLLSECRLHSTPKQLSLFHFQPSSQLGYCNLNNSDKIKCLKMVLSGWGMVESIFHHLLGFYWLFEKLIASCPTVCGLTWKTIGADSSMWIICCQCPGAVFDFELSLIFLRQDNTPLCIGASLANRLLH